MKYTRRLLLLFLGLIWVFTFNGNAQSNSAAEIFAPVKWSYEMEDLGDNEYELIFKATIDEGWHLYSQFIEEGGPIPTSFNFDTIAACELQGNVDERGELEEDYDPNFEMTLKFFSHEVSFVQRVKLKEEGAKITGFHEFMTCDDERCLPPEIVNFQFFLGTKEGVAGVVALEDVVDISKRPCDENPYLICNVDLENPVKDCGEKREDQTLWGIFLLGILGGFIALLTPCVFPMIPLTVSFFTKGSENRKKGMIRSALYGFFILLIYFLLSTPFHLLPDIDPEVLNRISTNTGLNILFFLIFVVFAISFFGYFEIVLPSKWANKADTASDVGGIIGVFFMALTLAIVSFSCTGPILGTLLAGTLNAEGAGVVNVLGFDMQLVAVKLSLGMTGFGLALGLPFALFAAFPQWLQSLPQSGGWLNTIKVILGFVELALAVKFLSNADLVEQWGLLKRETFFALWMIIGLGMFLYLIGKISFPHDNPKRKISVSGWVMALGTLGFSIYLLPGVFAGGWWNHNLLSGFPPPKYYSYVKKHHEIEIFTDYYEGLAHAREVNKPIMIDFTGWACVNCRKMEDNVWVEESIKNILNKEYVVISLYVDEKITLPEEEQEAVSVPTSDGNSRQKAIKTVGDRWSTLETLTFGSNTQPYYVLLDTDETLLANPVGYSYSSDITRYREYLKCGLKAYEEQHAVPSLFN